MPNKQTDIMIHSSTTPLSIIPLGLGVKYERVKDCKLCNSKYREEAEELYDRTESIKRVHKLLSEDRLEEISYGAVRNHLKFHYEAQSSNTLVKEYAGEVGQWIEMQDDQLAGLKRAMGMIEREMQIIGAHGEGLPLIERRKNAETVGKLGALMLSYRKQIEDMTAAKSGTTVVLRQLQIILQQEIKDVKSEETKRVVANIFNKLKDTTGHLDADDGEE
jgi:hypothetical protein